jgi:hypothetical protein
VGRRGEVEHPAGQPEAWAEEGDEGDEGDGRPGNGQCPGPKAEEREGETGHEELSRQVCGSRRQVCGSRREDAADVHRPSPAAT